MDEMYLAKLLRQNKYNRIVNNLARYGKDSRKIVPIIRILRSGKIGIIKRVFYLFKLGHKQKEIS